MSTSTPTPRKSGFTGTASPAARRGPVRVLLRLHRTALWVAGGLLALGIGIVVALRVWMASAKELCSDGDITPCGGPVYQSSYARTSTEVFLSEGGTVLLVLAALAGVFVAGPLIARELESGTFRLAWAQSVSPARWLATRLAVPAALVVSGLAVLIAVYRWGLWALRGFPYSSAPHWYDSGTFPGTGPALLGYALLAVAVGALSAVLVRRALLAMSLTALVLGAVAVGLGKRRYRLWPGELREGAAARTYTHGDWPLENGMFTASGDRLYWQDCLFSAWDNAQACMRDRGGVTPFAEVHPASHYWPLQLVETGILLALAALALFAAFRVLRRLHG
ncbi:ABC transporter permease [Streptomyces bacillaris]|uniref:ABC transporter permease n=1 Tax=unclassified Streptomyces TaxID=2593676 RepID=UPI00035F705F|nr:MULTISPECIES: ABC transporter permease [unclassified Streptomyces]MYT35975.1 ABC transporter permease [Streptomyces sp. SID8356]